jgi:hypothetical protein
MGRERTATASDETAMLQFESGPTMTEGQSENLLRRIWKREFGDVEFGIAPRRLSSPNDDD